MADFVALPPSPTKKTRRKRTKVPDNMTEEQKEEWRKRNNKEAAQDLRNRRKQYEDELTARASRLEEENRALELHASRLESEQASLRQKIDLFHQCMSAIDNEQNESSSSSQPLNGSLEPSHAQATAAMDVTDDNDFGKQSTEHQVVVDESAALNPQQSELQRMAPVLILLLGSILSQPLPSSTQAPCQSTTTASSSQTATSTASASNPTTSTTSSSSPSGPSGVRRSRRLAKRPSEAVHPPSPSVCQPALILPPGNPSTASTAPATTPSAPSLNPQALATSLSESSVDSSAMPQLIMMALQHHLGNIAKQASLNAIKAEAEDCPTDAISSLIPFLSAAA